MLLISDLTKFSINEKISFKILLLLSLIKDEIFSFNSFTFESVFSSSAKLLILLISSYGVFKYSSKRLLIILSASSLNFESPLSLR